jgi:hypothetical protein
VVYEVDMMHPTDEDYEACEDEWVEEEDDEEEDEDWD